MGQLVFFINLNLILQMFNNLKFKFFFNENHMPD